jgi:8-oxo-dGTP diphosphatase
MRAPTAATLGSPQSRSAIPSSAGARVSRSRQGEVVKIVVKKVVAFVLYEGSVAVFRQDDEDSGLQVPAGTLREGEDPEAGALREAQEETSLTRLRVVRFLGRYQWDISPIREEIQDRHVFQLAVDDPPPRGWVSYELHDGLHPPTTLRFCWLPLGDPELDTLVVGQGTLLQRVEERLQTQTPEIHAL